MTLSRWRRFLAHLLRRHAVQPHPLLPVILLETEEMFVGEHDALHVNTRARFRQYPTLPKFQTWKKLLAKARRFFWLVSRKRNVRTFFTNFFLNFVRK